MKIKTSQSSCSVQSWLDQRLEQRGIDARVYSKYILSLVTDSDDDRDDDLTRGVDVSLTSRPVDCDTLPHQMLHSFPQADESGLTTDPDSCSSKFALVIECLKNVCQAPNDAEAFVRELILLMRQRQPDDDDRISRDWESVTPDCVLVADSDVSQSTGRTAAPVGDSEETELARKFNQKIASIWESGAADLPPDREVAGQEVWGQSGGIWSFDPSSLTADSRSDDHVDLNPTSLQNHTTDSLFVRPLTSAGACKLGPGTQLTCDKATSRTENLLTSAATHFQPIRQDYYERSGNMVTDASVCGLVPCSGKCPNHGRNRTERRKETRPRPASTSMSELSLFVGPFVGEESDCRTSADKWTSTSDDGVGDMVTQTPVLVDDYDAICSILNDVLSRRDEDEELVDYSVTQSPSTTRIPVPVYESLSVDPESSGFLYSQSDSHMSYTDIPSPGGQDSVRRKNLFRQSVAGPVRRSSQSPAPLTRHFVIEPKIGKFSPHT